MNELKSKIILVKDIKLDKQYTNVLSYSEDDMLELCQTNAVASADDYSFIRNTGNIFTNFTYSQCLQANYIAFQNKDYSNKWFFAFIDDVIFKGEENTEIRYTVDSWSTWYDYWTKKNCFINRQHVLNDAIGSNTVDENLNVGDVICEEETEEISLSDYIWVAISSSWTPDDNSTSGGKQYSNISVYNGQIFANQIKLFQINDVNDYLNVGLFILRTNADGHIADIKNIFIVPDTVIDQTKLTSHSCQVQGTSQTYTILYYTMQFDNSFTSINYNLSKRTSFSDYTPKNNKCFVYPYNYLLVGNNIGNYNIFRYENFYNSQNATFRLMMAIGIGCSGKLVPINYKKISIDDDESIPVGKYPTCEWSSDAFINWLTQNAVNVPTSITSSIVNMSKQTPEQIGTSIASEVGNIIGTMYTGDLMPNIQGGQNTADINYISKRNTISFKEMRIKTEFLKIIDDYFTRFGYAIKKIDNPHLTGRRYWNYVEIGSNENIGYGSVPSKYMEEINGACRKGVTIWHEHDNLGDFSLNNTIV